MRMVTREPSRMRSNRDLLMELPDFIPGVVALEERVERCVAVPVERDVVEILTPTGRPADAAGAGGVVAEDLGLDVDGAVMHPLVAGPTHPAVGLLDADVDAEQPAAPQAVAPLVLELAGMTQVRATHRHRARRQPRRSPRVEESGDTPRGE